MRLNNLAIKAIKKYQKNKALIGSGRCRHFPTCSNYGIECFQKFNFFKASILVGLRILRCNPLFKRGYDPVPLTKAEKLEIKKYEKELSRKMNLEENNNTDPLNFLFIIAKNSISIDEFYYSVYIFKKRMKVKQRKYFLYLVNQYTNIYSII